MWAQSPGQQTFQGPDFSLWKEQCLEAAPQALLLGLHGPDTSEDLSESPQWFSPLTGLCEP